MEENAREAEEQNQGTPGHEPSTTPPPLITVHRITNDGVDFTYHIDHAQQKVYLEGRDGKLRYSSSNVETVSKYPLAQDTTRTGKDQPPYLTDLPAVPLSAINEPDHDEDPAVIDGRMVKDVPFTSKENEEKTKLDAQIRKQAQELYISQGEGKARAMNKRT